MNSIMKVDVEISVTDEEIEQILCMPIATMTIRDHLSASGQASKQDVVRAITNAAFARAEIRQT